MCILHPGDNGSAPPDIIDDISQTENTVIARDDDGKVVSRFSDDIWDFSTYSTSIHSGSTKIYFSKLQSADRLFAKRALMTVLYFSGAYFRSSSLTPGSLQQFARAIKNLSAFSKSLDSTIEEVLLSKHNFVEFLRTDVKRNTVQHLSSCFKHIVTSDPQISQISCIKKHHLTSLSKKLSTYPKPLQTAVIPDRILSNLIEDLQEFIASFIEREDDLISMLSRIAADANFGRSIIQQRKNGLRVGHYKLSFQEALEKFNLVQWAKKYQISDLNNFYTIFSTFQNSVVIFVCIYSGMRKQEILSLKAGCIRIDSVTGVTLLAGNNSKQDDATHETLWVTSPLVVAPIETSIRISEIVRQTSGSDEDLSVFEPLGSLRVYQKKRKEKSKESRWYNYGVRNSKARFFTLLDKSRYLITDDDIKFLQNIDPFRKWETEKNFQGGVPWHFTLRQFRRSLAYYVAQSNFVSLPSLKRQLQHVSIKMTLYYCQSHESESFSEEAMNDFARMVRGLKPLADATTFTRDIIQSDEPLWGVQGEALTEGFSNEESGAVLNKSREDLVREFTAGRIAYSETPLGACMSVSHCSRRPTLTVASCVGCISAVIKPSKVDSAIESLERLIPRIVRNSTDDFEWRSERAELDTLKKFRESKERKVN